MNRKARSFKVAVIVVVAAAVLIGAFAFYTLNAQRARPGFEPMMVMISEPATGETIPAGSSLIVSSTASGYRPIARLELWLDGELKGTQNSVRAEGSSPLAAALPLSIEAEGPHLLFARAIDIGGLIGQSTPVTIVGSPAPDPQEMVGSAVVQAGETLQDVAGALGSDTATLQRLNPGLTGAAPAGGTVIHVPPKSGGGAPAPSASPAGGGSIQVPNVPGLKVVQAFPVLGNLLPATNAPAAPDGLVVDVKDCTATLRWNDNSLSEVGYEVWMAAPGASPQSMAKLAASPAMGPAWAEIPIQPSGLLQFWVAALNASGSQPSNIVSVTAEQACATSDPTYLQVQALDITVPAGVGQAYCYVSIMNEAAIRVPRDESQFIEVAGGKAALAASAAADQNLVIPIPPDGSLAVSGECLGWSGSTLIDLGRFQTASGRDTWDGQRHGVQGDTYELGFAVNPLGGSNVTTFSGSYGPDIPPPFALVELAAPDISIAKGFPPARTLHWKWDGDASKLTGFAVYLNGKQVATHPYPDMRDVLVRLPGECGNHVRWEVVALGPSVQLQRYGPYVPVESRRSNPPVEYDQPPCQAYVAVKFDRLDVLLTDEEGWSGPCPTLEAYYALNVNDGLKKFYYPGGSGVGSSFFTVQCGKSYSLYDMGRPYLQWDKYPDTVVTTIKDPNKPFDIQVTTFFFDYDDWTGADWFGLHHMEYGMNSLKEAQEFFGCGTHYSIDYINSVAGTVLYYTVSVYPNACADLPPYIP